ncbi:MAG: hypothetical protein UX27_C0023G0002 [Candidatus Azambacteria bacterium GW2011_GWA2_45_90]|uniref:Uncharacterized protein n=1 Tax=Candidatus Azambacteria bacterium GW2011_GWA2_45_90 TaxID=1618614 RepID=A0A0G1NBS7_9BACT|nr:MAG: hypothetical protein UX27_C0023G0002 [Candidatus Azambacteria bacterium GW2011_GWA2_45_90]
MQEIFKKITEFSFEHSTARAFLVFSSIFLIFSIGYAKEYVLIAFFTFFYALVAHRIVVFRKTPKWGDNAVRTWFGALLYFLLDWSLFVGWIIGTMILLVEIHWASFLDLLGNAEYLNLFEVFYITIGFSFLTFLLWLGQAFWLAIRGDKK